MTDYLENALLCLYGDDFTYQKKRYIEAISKFSHIYNKKNFEVFSAPGRTEICGNHVDHNGGKVLAAAVNTDMIAVAAPLDEKIIKITSDGYAPIEVDLELLAGLSIESGTSSALIRGIATAIKCKGYPVCGFCAYITSDIKTGSGLSSSAAFEDLIGTIFNYFCCDSEFSPLDIAKLGKYAENEFFGKASGLMDQLTCALGGICEFDFKEQNFPKINKIDFDFDKFSHKICIVDTKSSHADLSDDYSAIPKEMKKVAGFFSKDELCELSKEDVLKNIEQLREFYGDRAVLRALHFFDENKRTQMAVEALKNNNFGSFLTVINSSGDSSQKYLQNLYSVSNAQYQSLVIALYLANEVLGKRGAARVHGGGFAGTIQAFVPDDILDAFINIMENAFGIGCVNILNIRSEGTVKL